jgi:hypothetical protein
MGADLSLELELMNESVGNERNPDVEVHGYAIEKLECRVRWEWHTSAPILLEIPNPREES